MAKNSKQHPPKSSHEIGSCRILVNFSENKQKAGRNRSLPGEFGNWELEKKLPSERGMNLQQWKESDKAANEANHLLLLVGENPLPNAVAGKLLVADGGKIWLIHSKGTFKVAERLRSWFGKNLGENNVSVDFREINESEPPSIANVIKEILNSTHHDEVIGLNYTGGTKAMAVHAYWKVREWLKEKSGHGFFSYVDARTLGMVITRADDQLTKNRHIGLAVQVNFTELIEMHGRDLKKLPACEPIHPQVTKALAKLNSTKEGNEKWNEWLKTELFKKCLREDREDKKWKGNGALKEIRLALPDSDVLADFVDSISHLSENGELNLGKVAVAFGYKECKDYGKYLDGMWLESYVLAQLQKIAQECKLHDLSMNIETEGVNFEFDVVAMRGYQLFAFSCTTDIEKGFSKFKLFEALIRARQLGGDEARVALVYCGADSKKLEEEVLSDIGVDVSSRRVRVFGREHFENLSQHFQEWLEAQSGGDD